MKQKPVPFLQKIHELFVYTGDYKWCSALLVKGIQELSHHPELDKM